MHTPEFSFIADESIVFKACYGFYGTDTRLLSTDKNGMTHQVQANHDESRLADFHVNRR